MSEDNYNGGENHTNGDANPTANDSAAAERSDANPSNDNDDTNQQLKLYIGNIDYSTDDARLRSVFDKYGTITDCFCPIDRSTNKPRGFGFVTFANRDDAMKAIEEMDNTDLDGRMIRVSESRPKEIGGKGSGVGANGSDFNASGASEVKLFVGNLSFDTDVATIKELFEKEGVVKDCYMPKDRGTDQPRGFAFVTMPSEDARNAMKNLMGYEVDGRSLRIEESMPRRSDVVRGGYGGGQPGGFMGGPPPMGGGYGAPPPYGGRFGAAGYGDPYARSPIGGYGAYPPRDRYDYDDRAHGYGGRDRGGRDRYDDRDSRKDRDRYDDDRGDRSSRDDRGNRDYDRSDRKRDRSRDREDRYRSSDRDRDRDRDRY